MQGDLVINALNHNPGNDKENGYTAPEVFSQLEDILQHAQKTYQRLLEHPESNDLGLSLYHCKHQVFSEYILNILFSILIDATSSTNEPLREDVAKALFKSRLFIEKSKPIETKMRFQAERLLEQLSSNQTTFDTNNAMLLSHKPNLLSILDDEGSDASSVSEQDGEGVYKAPKISPAFFHPNHAEFEKKKEASKKLMTKSRRLVNEFKQEFSSRPEEANFNIYRHDETENMDRSISQFEEENFTRLEMKKKKNPRAPKFLDALDELDSIGLLDKYAPDSEDEVSLFHPRKKNKEQKYLSKFSKKGLDEEIPSDEDYSPRPRRKDKKKK